MLACAFLQKVYTLHEVGQLTQMLQHCKLNWVRQCVRQLVDIYSRCHKKERKVELHCKAFGNIQSSAERRKNKGDSASVVRLPTAIRIA